mmetsp:Transcript_81623/g.210156  ORF Transcript_81623/g.210156 Transcript_81623/m.210156 type:complete len:1096 (+) Transcript_81623:452-3739(+)
MPRRLLVAQLERLLQQPDVRLLAAALVAAGALGVRGHQLLAHARRHLPVALEHHALRLVAEARQQLQPLHLLHRLRLVALHQVSHGIHQAAPAAGEEHVLQLEHGLSLIQAEALAAARDGVLLLIVRDAGILDGAGDLHAEERPELRLSELQVLLQAQVPLLDLAAQLLQVGRLHLGLVEQPHHLALEHALVGALHDVLRHLLVDAEEGGNPVGERLDVVRAQFPLLLELLLDEHVGPPRDHPVHDLLGAILAQAQDAGNVGLGGGPLGLGDAVLGRHRVPGEDAVDLLLHLLLDPLADGHGILLLFALLEHLVGEVERGDLAELGHQLGAADALELGGVRDAELVAGAVRVDIVADVLAALLPHGRQRLFGVCCLLVRLLDIDHEALQPGLHDAVEDLLAVLRGDAQAVAQLLQGLQGRRRHDASAAHRLLHAVLVDLAEGLQVQQAHVGLGQLQEASHRVERALLVGLDDTASELAQALLVHLEGRLLHGGARQAELRELAADGQLREVERRSRGLRLLDGVRVERLQARLAALHARELLVSLRELEQARQLLGVGGLVRLAVDEALEVDDAQAARRGLVRRQRHRHGLHAAGVRGRVGRGDLGLALAQLGEHGLGVRGEGEGLVQVAERGRVVLGARGLAGAVVERAKPGEEALGHDLVGGRDGEAEVLLLRGQGRDGFFRGLGAEARGDVRHGRVQVRRRRRGEGQGRRALAQLQHPSGALQRLGAVLRQLALRQEVHGDLAVRLHVHLLRLLNRQAKCLGGDGKRLARDRVHLVRDVAQVLAVDGTRHLRDALARLLAIDAEHLKHALHLVDACFLRLVVRERAVREEKELVDGDAPVLALQARVAARDEELRGVPVRVAHDNRVQLHRRLQPLEGRQVPRLVLRPVKERGEQPLVGIPERRVLEFLARGGATADGKAPADSVEDSAQLAGGGGLLAKVLGEHAEDGAARSFLLLACEEGARNRAEEGAKQAGEGFGHAGFAWAERVAEERQERQRRVGAQQHHGQLRGQLVDELRHLATPLVEALEDRARLDRGAARRWHRLSRRARRRRRRRRRRPAAPPAGRAPWAAARARRAAPAAARAQRARSPS